MDILKIARRVQFRCEILSQIAESADDSEIAVGFDWVEHSIENIIDADFNFPVKALTVEIRKFVKLKAELRQLIIDQAADDGNLPYYYCDVNGFHNIGKDFALELLTDDKWEKEFNE